jgi:outer membrane receptor protein involved in Fe transport
MVPASAEYSFSPNARYFLHVRYSEISGWGSADWLVDLGWQQIVDDLATRDFASSLRNRESNSSDLAGIAVSASRSMNGVSWIAGIEYYDDRVRSRRYEQDINSGGIQALQSRYPDGSRARQGALYLNAERRLGERHTLRGGIRFSAVDVKLPAASSVPAEGVNLNDVSADAGWLFDLTNGLQLVANVGRGFRAPNVFDLGTLGERPGNRYNIPSPDLQAEHVTQIDAGLRLQRPLVTAELVAYRLDYTNRIASVLTGAVTSDGRDVIQSRNVASAKIDGVEASVSVDFSPQMSAGALLNYTWGRQSEADGSMVAADRIPPLNGQLRVELAPVDRLALMASLQFAGRQDRLSPRDIRDVRIDPAGSAAWGALDLRAEWAPGDGWQLAVELGNLLDKRYRMHGSGIDATGRNVFISAARSW